MTKPSQYIDYEPLKSVDGLRFRHFSDEQDYQVRLDIFNACKEVNAIDYVITLDDIKNDETIMCGDLFLIKNFM